MLFGQWVAEGAEQTAEFAPSMERFFQTLRVGPNASSGKPTLFRMGEEEPIPEAPRSTPSDRMGASFAESSALREWDDGTRRIPVFSDSTSLPSGLITRSITAAGIGAIRKMAIENLVKNSKLLNTRQADGNSIIVTLPGDGEIRINRDSLDHAFRQKGKKNLDYLTRNAYATTHISDFLANSVRIPGTYENMNKKLGGLVFRRIAVGALNGRLYVTLFTFVKKSGYTTLNETKLLYAVSAKRPMRGAPSGERTLGLLNPLTVSPDGTVSIADLRSVWERQFRQHQEAHRHGSTELFEIDNGQDSLFPDWREYEHGAMRGDLSRVDAAYENAIKRGDTAIARAIQADWADRHGYYLFAPDDPTFGTFYVRKGLAPKMEHDKWDLWAYNLGWHLAEKYDYGDAFGSGASAELMYDDTKYTFNGLTSTFENAFGRTRYDDAAMNADDGMSMDYYFRLGLEHADLPHLVFAKRIWEPVGASENGRDQIYEKGTSVLGVYRDGEYDTGLQNGTYELFCDGKKFIITGVWRSRGYGGDGEYLLNRARTLSDNLGDIKSGDLVTYDDDGNAIPLSRRFNPSVPDIRFRLGSTETEGETLFRLASAEAASAFVAREMERLSGKKLGERAKVARDGGGRFLKWAEESLINAQAPVFRWYRSVMAKVPKDKSCPFVPPWGGVPRAFFGGRLWGALTGGRGGR